MQQLTTEQSTTLTQADIDALHAAAAQLSQCQVVADTNLSIVMAELQEQYPYITVETEPAELQTIALTLSSLYNQIPLAVYTESQQTAAILTSFNKQIERIHEKLCQLCDVEVLATNNSQDELRKLLQAAILTANQFDECYSSSDFIGQGSMMGLKLEFSWFLDTDINDATPNEKLFSKLRSLSKQIHASLDRLQKNTELYSVLYALDSKIMRFLTRHHAQLSPQQESDASSDLDDNNDSDSEGSETFSNIFATMAISHTPPTATLLAKLTAVANIFQAVQFPDSITEHVRTTCISDIGKFEDNQSNRLITDFLIEKIDSAVTELTAYITSTNDPSLQQTIPANALDALSSASVEIRDYMVKRRSLSPSTSAEEEDHGSESGNETTPLPQSHQ